MTTTEQGFEVRRIVVAIDNSTHSTSALEAAASLAAHLHAELEGLFVEDINLERLAALPIGREVQFLTGQCRDFTADTYAEQNREQAVSARHAIAAAAARAHVTHAFRVTRGQVDVEVISAAGDADLLILGMGSRSIWGRGRLGATAPAAAERAPRSVLISKPGMRSIDSPLVCYDGSAGAKRALEAALRLSGTRDKALTVLIVAEDVEKSAVLRREIDDRLAPLQIQPNYLHSANPAPEQMCQIAAKSGSNVLVIGADSDLLAGAERIKVLETISCPVLLVR